MGKQTTIIDSILLPHTHVFNSLFISSIQTSKPPSVIPFPLLISQTSQQDRIISHANSRIWIPIDKRIKNEKKKSYIHKIWLFYKQILPHSVWCPPILLIHLDLINTVAQVLIKQTTQNVNKTSNASKESYRRRRNKNLKSLTYVLDC